MTELVETASTRQQLELNAEPKTTACAKPTTNLQPEPDAEPKTEVSAKSFGR